MLYTKERNDRMIGLNKSKIKNRFWKKTFLLMSSALFAGVFYTNVAFADYYDVPKNISGSEEIYYLNNKGIIQGYPDGTFKPEANLTRKHAVVMLGRALQWKYAGDTKQQFKDVSTSDDAFNYIAKAKELGILDGYADGTFRPNENLTRAQMAKILGLAFHLTNQFPTPFKDVVESHWAKDNIQTVASNGVVSGYEDSTYKPNLEISRKHYSMMLSRALESNFSLTMHMKVKVPENDTLNVRKTASASSQIVGKLYNGMVVKVKPTDVPGWLKITYKDLEGYAAVNYMEYYRLSQLPLEGKTIVLDAGHGGTDSGASSNGVVEKHIVLKTTLSLEKELEKKGALVFLTRRTDVFLTLDERALFSEPRRADIFISVHANASDGRGNGSETYYNDSKYQNTTNPFPKESKALASSIQDELAKTNLKNRGVKEAAYLVIRKNSVPSVLVELGFVDNVTDAEYLKDDNFLNKSAQLISAGIETYFQKN